VPRAVRIAHHYCEASTTVRDAVAADWAVRAGAEAARGFAFAEAADWYERALRLGIGADAERAAAINLALGLACDNARRPERARAAYLAGAARAREVADPALLADLAIAAAPAWTSGVQHGEIEQLVESALERLGDRDPSRRILLLGRIATRATTPTTTASAASSRKRARSPNGKRSTRTPTRPPRCRGTCGSRTIRRHGVSGSRSPSRGFQVR